MRAVARAVGSLGLGATLAFTLPIARAQDPPKPSPRPTQPALEPDEPSEDQDLREQLLQGERGVAIPAAIDLFLSRRHPDAAGHHDRWLREVLTTPTSKPEARRFLLEALGLAWRLRPDAAAKLAHVALFDQDATVRDAAMASLGLIERPECYAELFLAFKEAAQKPAGAERALALDVVTSVVEKKKDPIQATGVLVDALTLVEGADEARIHEALRRLTGRAFATDEAWRAWYDAHKGVPQREWLLETIRQLEAERDRASAAAERLFSRLLAAAGKDQDILLAELREALGKDSIPAVRLAAIRALGTLKRSEKAVDLLVQVIDTAPKEQEDLYLREALVALGSTEEPKALPVIVRFLENGNRKVRLASIQALGNLRAESGIPVLLALLKGKDGAPLCEKDPEAAARVAAAIGRIGKDPNGDATRALVELVDRIRALKDGTPPPEQRSQILQSACDGLGGIAPALAPNGPLAKAVCASLGALVEQQDADVRREATLALGDVPDDQAIPLLTARLKKTDESHKVRKAAIKALGDQAQGDKLADGVLAQIVDLLADALASADDDFRGEARNQLRRLTTRERTQLDALELLVAALAKHGGTDGAAPFLDALVSPKTTPDVPAPRAARIWALILERAQARVRLDDAKGALADLDDLKDAPLALDPKNARAMALARAQALHATGDHRRAADLAADLARKDPKDAAAWKVLRAAWEELIKKGERAVVKELFASVQKAMDDATADVKAALSETARKADEAPQPEPSKPPSTNGGS